MPTPASRVISSTLRSAPRAAKRRRALATLRSTDGKLTGVAVHAGGESVPGHLSHHKTLWKSLSPLHTDTTYTVEASAVDGSGTPTTKSVTFHTLKPSRVEETTIFESHDATY